MTARRVLLVDDHSGFAASARALLIHEGFDVVGLVGSGEAALEVWPDLHPDLLLLDVHLPGLSGVDVAHAVSAAADPPRMILISSDADAATDPDVVNAPVCGFLAKRDISCATIDALLS
jgi:DNA-binding NarL/FixJ family response regulator